MAIRERRDPYARMAYYVCATMYVKGYGYRPSIVVEGVAGHHPTGDDDWETNPSARRPYFWGPTLKDAEDTCAYMNERVGLSAQDVLTIIRSSMFPRGKRAKK